MLFLVLSDVEIFATFPAATGIMACLFQAYKKQATLNEHIINRHR
jgi:hypothetical protein